MNKQEKKKVEELAQVYGIHFLDILGVNNMNSLWRRAAMKVYRPWQEDPHLLAFLAHVVRAKVGDELPAPQMKRFFEQITSHIAGKVVQ